MRTTYRNQVIGCLAAAVFYLSFTSGYLENGRESSPRDYPAVSPALIEKNRADSKDRHPLWLSEKTGRSLIPVWDTAQW